MSRRVLTLLIAIALGIALMSSTALAQSSNLGTSLASLEGQVSVALSHANLAKSASTVSDKVKHAEHVINAIEGKTGANYGDLNGDGTVEDLGDGTGILGHATVVLELASSVESAVPGDATVTGHISTITSNTNNVIAWAGSARDAALNISGASLSLADIHIGPGGNTVISNLDASLSGWGTNGGVTQAITETQALDTYLAEIGANVPEPTLPDGGDSSIPMLAKIFGSLGLLLIVTVASGNILKRRRTQA